MMITSMTMMHLPLPNWHLYLQLLVCSRSVKFSDNQDSNHEPFFSFAFRSTVLRRIEELVENLVQSISQGQSPVLAASNRHTWCNIRFDIWSVSHSLCIIYRLCNSLDSYWLCRLLFWDVHDVYKLQISSFVLKCTMALYKTLVRWAS